MNRNVIRLLIFAAIVAFIALTIAPPVRVEGNAQVRAGTPSPTATAGGLPTGNATP